MSKDNCNYVEAKCYKSKYIVRPQFKYALAVWDPVTKPNIAKLKSVRRNAASFYRQTSSFTSMLKQLGGPSIKARSEHGHNDV